MLSIKEIFYHVQAAAHLNIPAQDQLRNKVNDYQERFNAAEQGIFINPIYRTHPFDKNSTQGKIYCDTLESDLTNAKTRLNIFYPASAPETSPNQSPTKVVIKQEPL